jgi:hypothetical protein
VPPSAPKQTLARIDFLRRSGQLVDKKAAFVLKFMPKNGQNGWGVGEKYG